MRHYKLCESVTEQSYVSPVFTLPLAATDEQAVRDHVVFQVEMTGGGTCEIHGRATPKMPWAVLAEVKKSEVLPNLPAMSEYRCVLYDHTGICHVGVSF